MSFDPLGLGGMDLFAGQKSLNSNEDRYLSNLVNSVVIIGADDPVGTAQNVASNPSAYNVNVNTPPGAASPYPLATNG